MLVFKDIFVSGKLGWTHHLMDFAALMHPYGLNSSISWTFEFVYFESIYLVGLNNLNSVFLVYVHFMNFILNSSS